MKNFLFVLFITSVSIFTGCSLTYRLKDDPFKLDFYENYNNFAGDKNVKITMQNDSVFYSINGTVILNDTLFSIIKDTSKKNYAIPISGIKKIVYTYTGNKTVNILLKNRHKLKARNISLSKDTISFVETRILYFKKAIIPVNKIKKISYKNHWEGIISGISYGMFIGVISGTLGFYTAYNSNQINGLPSSTAVGLGIGAITGTILGWLFGYNYTYIFNP